MRLLLTGASGFIGKNLLLRLPEGWQVTAVYHRDAGFPAFLRRHRLPHVRPMACDLTSPEAVARLRRRCGGAFDALLHLAGHVHPARSVEAPWEDLQANTAALLNTLEAFEAARCVYVSSGAVYEGCRGPVSPAVPVAPTLPYAIAKLAGEQYVKFYALRRGSVGRYVILRFFGAFGPQEPPRKIYTRLVRALALEGRSTFTIRGDGRNHIDAMYVADAVRGLLAVLRRPTAGNVTVDFAQGEPLTMRALVERAARCFGRRLRLRCEGPTQEALRCRASREGMRRAFGITPALTLEEGLRRFAAFLRTSEIGAHG